MALVSYSVKSPCWRIGTRLNGCSARCAGLPISGSRSRNVYETSLWVSTSRTICTKVLRGNPSTIGSGISFLPVSAQRGPSHADGRSGGIWHIDTYVASYFLHDIGWIKDRNPALTREQGRQGPGYARDLDPARSAKERGGQEIRACKAFRRLPKYARFGLRGRTQLGDTYVAFCLALGTVVKHETRSAQSVGPQLAAAGSSAAGQARLPAGQNLAPPAGYRRRRGEERRARTADERGDARRLRMAAARDPGRRRRSFRLRSPLD